MAQMFMGLAARIHTSPAKFTNRISGRFAAIGKDGRRTSIQPE